MNSFFGRIRVDKAQNSFISEKCDFFAGLWELARITKLPIQYSARTTTGTGISCVRCDGTGSIAMVVLIPELKAEPEDPVSIPMNFYVPTAAELVFVPKLGIHRERCR